MYKKITALLAGSLLLGATAINANANAVIKTGNTYLGINSTGELNVSESAAGSGDVNPRGSFVGLTWGGLGDATSPGCLCEGWGAAANGISGWRNRSVGNSNITGNSFTTTASTAVSDVYLTSLPGLSINHSFQPSASENVFEVIVTIKNATGSVASDVRYTRAMDWDIPVREFSEFVTIRGTSTTSELLYSSDNGFVTSDPFGSRSEIASCGITSDFEDCGPADHGAVFDFGFGDLADGEEKEFSIFYGAESNEEDALATLSVIEAELFSLGQERDDPATGTPATFIFGFKGVGGTVLIPSDPGTPVTPGNPPITPPTTGVPEPTTLAILALGLIGFGFSRKTRKSSRA